MPLKLAAFPSLSINKESKGDRTHTVKSVVYYLNPLLHACIFNNYDYCLNLSLALATRPYYKINKKTYLKLLLFKLSD